eukprot:1393334-Amorphochlora_amoeboformis.AAC.1
MYVLNGQIIALPLFVISGLGFGVWGSGRIVNGGEREGAKVCETQFRWVNAGVFFAFGAGRVRMEGGRKGNWESNGGKRMDLPLF